VARCARHAVGGPETEIEEIIGVGDRFRAQTIRTGLLIPLTFSTSKAGALLVVSKHGHGVDPRCAASRDVASRSGGHREDESNRSVGDRIKGADPVEIALH
jgi:hypothetical protein